MALWDWFGKNQQEDRVRGPLRRSEKLGDAEAITPPRVFAHGLLGPVTPEQREQVFAADRAKYVGHNADLQFDAYAQTQKEAAGAHYYGRCPATVSPPNAALQAVVDRCFGLDIRWQTDVRDDAARVIAALRANQPATLQNWSATRFDSVFTYDDYGTGGHSVNALRRLTRESVLAAVQREVNDARASFEREARHKAAEQERLAAEAKEAERQRRLALPIPLAMNPAGIVFGTPIDDGVDFVVPVRQMRHSLLAGVAGAGKSVLLKGLIHQLIRSPEVDRLILIDLKEGVTFFGFRDDPKCEVIYELPDVVRVIAKLMPTMAERLRRMRNDGVELYRNGRTFVIIDEYTEIQSAIDRADKRSPVRELADNLENLSRRGRAAGIVMICALQKPTLDGISSGIRNNCDCRLVLRTATSQLAASMLEELHDLPVKPTRLPNGRYYYFDASKGIRRLLQAQIAPGVDLGDAS